MTIAVAKSTASTPTQLAAELAQQLPGTPRALIYFASSNHDSRQLAEVLQGAFRGATTFGCSTAGELVGGAMLKGAAVAMALYDDDVEDLAVELITPPDDAAALKPAAERLGARLGTPLRDLSPRDHVGLVLVDGMSLGEERMMDCLGGLTDMKIVGGSAGDDLKFKETFVAARGQCSARGAVLAVLKPRRRFDILKTQSFRRGGRVLCATRVDEAARIVHEFDGRPAAAAYAEAIGCPLAALSSHFMSRPLGLVVDDEPYVRSPQRVVDDSVAFYCAVKTGMELEVLDATNIIEDTQRALAAKVTELGGLRGIVNFNCILRTLELEQRGLQTQYAELFRDYPTIGFSTYGEQYLGHINQTATMLLFS